MANVEKSRGAAAGDRYFDLVRRFPLRPIRSEVSAVPFHNPIRGISAVWYRERLLRLPSFSLINPDLV